MYTRELIKKFELEDAKISKTLMAATTKLNKDKQDKNVGIKPYRNMIDSLLYLTASSRTLYLMFVCVPILC